MNLSVDTARVSPRRRVLPRALSLAIALALPALASADDTADAVLSRLQQLESRLDQLEHENRELREQLQFRTERLERVENRAARAAQPAVVPSYASVNGDFTFKLRGVVDADAVAFHAREGGYDYNSGTGFRRARIGLEGDFYRDFKWRAEADFAGNQVSLTDAYVQYVAVRPWVFTFGQHKAPYGLESNNSDNYNTFLERGIVTNAFGTPGAERRIGLSAFRGTDKFTLGVGVFGDGESSTRADNEDSTTIATCAHSSRRRSSVVPSPTGSRKTALPIPESTTNERTSWPLRWLCGRCAMNSISWGP